MGGKGQNGRTDRNKQVKPRTLKCVLADVLINFEFVHVGSELVLLYLFMVEFGTVYILL